MLLGMKAFRVYSDGPNIKGTISSLRSTDDENANPYRIDCIEWKNGNITGSGCSYLEAKWNSVSGKYDPQINASWSNSLYSDSVTTVSPNAFRVLALVRAY